MSVTEELKRCLWTYTACLEWVTRAKAFKLCHDIGTVNIASFPTSCMCVEVFHQHLGLLLATLKFSHAAKWTRKPNLVLGCGDLTNVNMFPFS